MLTIASGHSASYLTDQVAVGRENYYSGAVAAGEPPGRWYGAGAELLGLQGLVETQDMEALFEHFVDPRDPAFGDPRAWDDADKLGHGGRRYADTDAIHAALVQAEPHASPERIEELRLEAARRTRKNVAFYDATFSVQKSVTVLHTAFEAMEVRARAAGDEEAAAAWGAHREAVESSIWVGNRALLDYMAEVAGYSRVGHHGGAAGRYIDAHGLVIASFFQHDNRDHDPQLHIHNAILNRVQGSDGVWRTLDGRALYAHRAAAAAIGERAMEEQLARTLGVTWATRPDGKAREIVGIAPEVLDLFSQRRRAITAKSSELVSAFETKFGHAPNALQLDRLQRTATMATRKAKSHDGETIAERLERWDRQLRAEVADGLAGVARDVLALRGEAPETARWSADVVIETALADLQARKASWTESDLTRAISDALPDYLGGLDAAAVQDLLTGLASRALDSHAVRLTAEAPGESTLPEALRLADGRSAYEPAGSRLYATVEHLNAERVLRAAATGQGAVAVPADRAAAYLEALAESGLELGADQGAAVRGVLCSGARVEALVGPAGTGKSYVVGALARAWTDPALWDGAERRVVGLATSQIATEVLAGEGLEASNVARWLATQRRLAEGIGMDDDQRWAVRDGDLVVVDESAMSSTADLLAVKTYTDAAGAKLLLTGDHRQLAAVGAGGGMELVAAAGATHELAEVRRFAHAWEREASLRLREGDAGVLHEYRKHGRIIDAGTAEQAQDAASRAYLADVLAGRDSLFIADTNEHAASASAHIRAELVRLGRVTETGVPLDRDGTTAGVGDLVQARRNGWHLAGVDGNRRGPINRERYRVLEVREGGGLVVTTDLTGDGLGERISLPGDYAAEHLSLGYASTVHAAQGKTVDTCHTVTSASTGAPALYVGLSRGRHANTAYVVTRSIPDDAPPGAGAGAGIERRDPLTVLIGAMETCRPDRSALAEAEASAADAGSLRTAAERFADAAELASAGRTAAILDRLADEGVLTSRQRHAIAADEAMPTLARMLRQAEVAGHDPAEVLRSAVQRNRLDTARSLASVLQHRILESTTLDPAGDTYADWTPKVTDPAWQRHLDDLAAAADRRRIELGAAVRDEQPQWAIEAFGPVPDSSIDRHEWQRRVGIVAAHRELTDQNDLATALPGPPKPGQVEAYASWRAAWRALGRPDADRAEAEMSDGRLRVRVRAYEREKAWEPPYVAHELAGTAQAENRHRQAAELRAAEAEAALDPAERDRLVREAGESAALADLLAARRSHLEEADHVRGLWYAHTAETRANAERARAELGVRGIDPDRPEESTTAEEWLVAHHDAERAEDTHREVTADHQLTDVAARREADPTELPDDSLAAQPCPPDARRLAHEQPGPPGPATRDWTTVPTADQTARALAAARRALAELEARVANESVHEAEDALSADLARYHARDRDGLSGEARLRSEPALGRE